MNINDNLKLAAYAVAADAFDKSKNIFWGFVPLVETALIMTAGQNSVSFLKLRDSINNLYNVSIPKDTLRYLINILVQEHKVQFIGNRTIVLDTDIVNSEYIVNHETAKAEIEKFFYAFQEFLISQDVDISIEEIRENVCQWIYTHSYELAEFIQSGIYQIVKPSDKTDEDPSETYWQYTEIFFNFLLKCRAEDSTSYHSFLKLFEGAIQSTLLNFKPSKIEEVSDKNFNIGTAILDTNFLLRLLKLQPELDNETAYITWTTLKESGTNFIVLDHIQDPGNLGTIIRSASGTSFKNIFLINCVDVFSQKVIRSSMGGIFKIKAKKFVSCNEFLSFALAQNLKYYVASMEGENLFGIKNKISNIGVAVGNEGNGVSSLIKDRAFKTISIPMQNGLESLNVGVSCSIIIYYLDNLR